MQQILKQRRVEITTFESIITHVDQEFVGKQATRVANSILMAQPASEPAIILQFLLKLDGARVFGSL